MDRVQPVVRRLEEIIRDREQLQEDTFLQQGDAERPNWHWTQQTLV